MKRKCCILEKDAKKDDIDNKHNNEDILMKNKFGFLRASSIHRLLRTQNMFRTHHHLHCRCRRPSQKHQYFMWKFLPLLQMIKSFAKPSRIYIELFKDISRTSKKLLYVFVFLLQGYQKQLHWCFPTFCNLLKMFYN